MNTRIQGYLFANDIKICIRICLGDAPVIQNEQYTTVTSPVNKNNWLCCIQTVHNVGIIVRLHFIYVVLFYLTKSIPSVDTEDAEIKVPAAETAVTGNLL